MTDCWVISSTFYSLWGPCTPMGGRTLTRIGGRPVACTCWNTPSTLPRPVRVVSWVVVKSALAPMKASSTSYESYMVKCDNCVHAKLLWLWPNELWTVKVEWRLRRLVMPFTWACAKHVQSMCKACEKHVQSMCKACAKHGQAIVLSVVR